MQNLSAALGREVLSHLSPTPDKLGKIATVGVVHPGEYL
jgi:hypothetical protein